MGDDNDFTFCQVGVNVDQNHVEVPSAVLDIGGVVIKDDLLGSSGNHKMFSVEKGNSSENAPVQNQGKVGSLAFTVVDISTTKPSTELPKKVVPSNVKDPAMSPEEQLISTRKPIVRTKVPFEKGYSQMDWLKLTRTHPDLAGLKGASNKRIISMDEVKQHRAEGSIWTVLKGRVYNITPYMNFHPGGVDMLLKAAGKDCTSLFNKYHAWVNADFLLEKCLVGTLDESR